MDEPETPLVLTFLVRFRRLIVAAVAVVEFAPISVVIIAISSGPLAIWWIVRRVNRRDDPRTATRPLGAP
jgi:hypothetical protein